MMVFLSHDERHALKALMTNVEIYDWPESRDVRQEVESILKKLYSGSALPLIGKEPSVILQAIAWSTQQEWSEMFGELYADLEDPVRDAWKTIYTRVATSVSGG